MSIKRLRNHLSLLIGLGLAVGASADPASSTSPYVGQQQRIIKALSAQDVADLEAGRGMGLSKVAELNHYPGPAHVLAIAESLTLSNDQRTKITAIYETMGQDAQRLGAKIIAGETALDGLFAAPAVDAGRVRELTMQIAALQGELRFVHVRAHLTTAQLLTPEQIAMYDQLRGYHTHGDSSAPHHH